MTSPYFDAYTYPFPAFPTRPACADRDPRLFDDEHPIKEWVAEAKRVCRSCPVRDACLDYAIGNDERQGIWGGLTTRERALMWSKAGTAA